MVDVQCCSRDVSSSVSVMIRCLNQRLCRGSSGLTRQSSVCAWEVALQGRERVKAWSSVVSECSRCLWCAALDHCSWGKEQVGLVGVVECGFEQCGFSLSQVTPGTLPSTPVASFIGIPDTPPGSAPLDAPMTPVTDDSPQKKMLGQKATPPPSPLLSELLKKGSLLPTSPRLVWSSLLIYTSTQIICSRLFH